MTISASPPKNSSLTNFYQKDLEWDEAQRLRTELIEKGYRYVTIKAKLNHEGTKMPSDLTQAKIDRVRELVASGGRVVGGLIVFEDVTYAGYGKWINQIGI